MFLKMLASGRDVVMTVVVSIFAVALAFMLYQTTVIFVGIFNALAEGNVTPKVS